VPPRVQRLTVVLDVATPPLPTQITCLVGIGRDAAVFSDQDSPAPWWRGAGRGNIATKTDEHPTRLYRPVGSAGRQVGGESLACRSEVELDARR